MVDGPFAETKEQLGGFYLIRLTGLMVDLVPGSAEAKGLLALELFHHARMDARVDGAGEMVLLADQDRSRWDLQEIGTANRVLRDALGESAGGPFQFQAMIAGFHANARTPHDTDWASIVAVYNRLLRLSDSPVVRLHRAVAMALVDGPHVGLQLLDRIDGLDDYYLFHSAQAALLLRAGRNVDAVEAFRRARALTTNPLEQRHLERRIGVAAR